MPILFNFTTIKICRMSEKNPILWLVVYTYPAYYFEQTRKEWVPGLLQICLMNLRSNIGWTTTAADTRHLYGDKYATSTSKILLRDLITFNSLNLRTLRQDAKPDELELPKSQLEPAKPKSFWQASLEEEHKVYFGGKSWITSKLLNILVHHKGGKGCAVRPLPANGFVTIFFLSLNQLSICCRHQWRDRRVCLIASVIIVQLVCSNWHLALQGDWNANVKI